MLDKGQIAARGTHEELIEDSPLYAEIFASQLVEDADGEPRASGDAALQSAAAAAASTGKEIA